MISGESRSGAFTAGLAKVLAILLLFGLMSACSGSSDLKSVEITAENQAEIYDAIYNGNYLSGAELELLRAYLDRQDLDSGAKLPTGKTIARMLEEQRAHERGEELPPERSSASNDTRSPFDDRDEQGDSSKRPTPVAAPTTATLSDGSVIRVSLDESISSKRNSPGDTFEATLLDDLRSGDHLLAPAGSRVIGRLPHVKKSGKVKGRAEMTITLRSLRVEGESYRVETNTLSFQAKDSKGDDAKKVGIGAAAGAVIGAIAGGGKGAAIGAGIGAGAGGGAVLATSGKEVEFNVEQTMEFKLSQGVEMKIVRK